MQRSFKSMIGALAILALAGCGALNAGSTATGTSAADVRAKLGAPSDERTVAGVKAWDYVNGPEGFTTWRLTFDGSDRVAKVEQIITTQRVYSLKADVAGRDDVLNLLGRPIGRVTYGGNRSEIWTYRFIDGQDKMLGDVYFDASTGKVKGTSVYRDPAYSSALTS